MYEEYITGAIDEKEYQVIFYARREMLSMYYRVPL